MPRPNLSPGSKVSIGEKYGYAMEITDPREAAEYFEACVAHNMSFGEHSRAEAERVERINLGYYAGYYDSATRERVERLFSCAHPIFGSIATKGLPSTGDALWSGVREAMR